MRRLRRLALWVALGLSVLVALALVFLPPQLDARLNTVMPHPRATPSARASAIHESLVVMDWHADSLLWKRDLRERHRIGHVDLPRLVEGGVSIQMFTAVTRSPAGVDYSGNHGTGPDLNTFQALVQLWPPETCWACSNRSARSWPRPFPNWIGSSSRPSPCPSPSPWPMSAGRCGPPWP